MAKDLSWEGAAEQYEAGRVAAPAAAGAAGGLAAVAAGALRLFE